MPLDFIVFIEAPFKRSKIEGFIRGMQAGGGSPAGTFRVVPTFGGFRRIFPDTPYFEPPGREVTRGITKRMGAAEQKFIQDQVDAFLEGNPPARLVHQFLYTEPQAVTTGFRIWNPDPEFNPARYLAVSAPVPGKGSQLLLPEVRDRAPYKPWYIIDNYNVFQAIGTAAQELKAGGTVYLATDNDDEGEGIGWHIQQVMEAQLGRKKVSFRRVRYSELTLPAVRQAFQAADAGETLNVGVVAAQSTRERLDRLIGFPASRAIWPIDGGRREKTTQGLSLGRVQLAALFMLLEDEEVALQKLPSISYSAVFDAEARGETFKAKFSTPTAFAGFSNPKELVKKVKAQPGSVVSFSEEPRTWHRLAFYSLPTLQKDMLRVYGMTASQVLESAQALYEQSAITYPRSDSDSVSADGLRTTVAFAEELGLTILDPFVSGQGVRRSSGGAGVQGAHEAVRPLASQIADRFMANMKLPQPQALPQITGLVKAGRGINALAVIRTYDMIFRRSVSALLPAVEMVSRNAFITHPALPGQTLAAVSQQITKPGWSEVFTFDKLTPWSTPPIPKMAVGDPVKLSLRPSDVKAQATAARRPRAQGLNEQLTKKGIGRPASTASMLDLLSERGYVAGETDADGGMSRFGAFIANFARNAFRGSVSIDTTALMEQALRELRTKPVKQLTTEATKLLDGFYAGRFVDQLQKARVMAWALGGGYRGKDGFIGLDRVGRFLTDSRDRLQGIYGVKPEADPGLDELLAEAIPLGQMGGRERAVAPSLWQYWGSLRYIPSAHENGGASALLVWKTGREFAVRLYYFYRDPEKESPHQNRALMFTLLAGPEKLADSIASVVRDVGAPLRALPAPELTYMGAWEFLIQSRLRVLASFRTALIDSNGLMADMRRYNGERGLYDLVTGGRATAGIRIDPFAPDPETDPLAPDTQPG